MENGRDGEEGETNKTETGESSNPSYQGEFQETSISDLPPEILMEILKSVDHKSLFQCRRVNRQWSEISSQLLCKRRESAIRFSFENLSFSCSFKKMRGKSLEDFLKCMSTSKNCPFVRFYFSIKISSNPSEFFRHKDFKQLVSEFVTLNQNQNQNHRIKFLGLYFKNTQPSLLLNANLRDLLVTKIPHLEDFQLLFNRAFEQGQPKLGLFAVRSPNQQEMNANSALASVSVPVPVSVVVPFELPHLKMLRLGSFMFHDFPQMSVELLNAAINLECIDVGVSAGGGTVEAAEFLLTLRKPYIVKQGFVYINERFLSKISNHGNHGNGHLNPPVLKFEELDLSIDMTIYASICRSLCHVTHFLSNLFECSRNSLTKLKMGPLGFLSSLQLPRFKNLKRLNLSQVTYPIDPSHQRHFFPAGVRALDIFPVVNSLDFSMSDWQAGFPQEDSIPVLSRVETVCVSENGFNQDSVSILALMCPSLKHLKIDKNCYGSRRLNFLNVARGIWTHMKQLESLELAVDVDLPENSPSAFDSGFTGIPIENCQRLFDLKEGDRSLKKWGYPTEIVGLDLTAKREHPSILVMKDLKKLTINPYSGQTVLEIQDFIKRTTWISQEYAFELMPHLKISCKGKAKLESIY